MEGKIKISEEEVKEMVRRNMAMKIPKPFRITDISARTSYCLDIEVEFTDEPEEKNVKQFVSEADTDDNRVEILFHDIPDEAA